MPLSPQFAAASSAWIAKEVVMERQMARPINLAQAVMPGASQDVLREALRTRPLFFDPLADVQNQILSTLATPDGISAIFSMSVGAIARDLNRMKSDADFLAGVLNDLATQVAAPPEEVSLEQRLAAARALEDVASSLERAAAGRLYTSPAAAAAQTADTILALVDKGVLDPDQVNDWLGQNALARQVYKTDRIQVVDSLGDRVWRLARQEPGRASNDAAAPGRPRVADAAAAGVELVDESGAPVLGISGVTSATLSPDGVLIVRGGFGVDPNAVRVLELRPVQDVPLGRVPQSPSLKVGVQNVLTSAATDLEDTARFDIWACLVLDFADLVEKMWRQITGAMQRILNQLRNALVRVMSGAFLLALPEITLDWRAPLGDLIDLALQQLPDGGQSLVTAVGILNQIGPIDLGSNNLPLCGLEQTRYCQTHSRLIDLKRALDDLLQKLQVRLTGQDALDLLDLLGYDPLVVVGVIEDALAPLDELIRQADAVADDIKGDICGWVRRRQQGVPASVSQMQAFMVQMIVLIPAILPLVGLSALGVPSVQTLVDMVTKLKKMGFDGMADDLESMNLDSLFGGLDNATGAGKVSGVLAQAARQTQYLDRGSKLQRLADSTATRNNQAISAQKTRSAIRARYHAPGPLAIAQATSEQAAPLIVEVDLESDRNR